MFKVGDRVETTESGYLSIGKQGVVKGTHITPCSKVLTYEVEFDERTPMGHDGDHGCKDGHGWWVLPSDLKFISVDYPARTIALMKARWAS